MLGHDIHNDGAKIAPGAKVLKYEPHHKPFTHAPKTQSPSRTLGAGKIYACISRNLKGYYCFCFSFWKAFSFSEARGRAILSKAKVCTNSQSERGTGL